MNSIPFQETVLGNVLKFYNGKSIKSSDAGTYPVYGSNGIIGRSEEYIYSDGLIIGRVGAYCGSIEYCPNKFWASDNTIVAKLKTSQDITLYMFYLLRVLNLNRYAGGSAQPLLTQTTLKQISIRIPSQAIQKKIAFILSRYDDLIENNTRRIKILEEMAQLIYREWFVKFRFPGHENVKMVDSGTEFGMIPEGWEVKSVGQILTTLESGSRPKGGIIESLQEGVPSIGAENINGLGNYDFSKEKYVLEEFYNNMKRGIVSLQDVLLYKDGANIGRKSMFRDNYPHAKCCVNEHVFILRTQDCFYQDYLYFWLDQEVITAKIQNLNANAAQPGINQSGVKSLPIIIPPKHILSNFNSIIEPLLGLLFSAAKKNLILRQTRDLLLPKLISGEIDVENMDIDISSLFTSRGERPCAPTSEKPEVINSSLKESET